MDMSACHLPHKGPAMPAANATAGPVVLTPREIAFFDQLRERLLHGMDATVGETQLLLECSGLPTEFWGFALTLYQPRHARLMVVRAAARPSFENIRSAVARARNHPRFGHFDPADRDRCRLQIDFIPDPPAPADFESFSESALDGRRFEFGIDGLRILDGGQRRYLLPGDAFVSSLLGLRQLKRRVQRLFPGISWEQLEFQRFRSISFVSTSGGWVRLVRGYPAVTPATAATLHAAATAGARWIVDRRLPDGRFTYYYDAATDSQRDHEHPTRDPRTDPYYNLLRHCGGVITLLLWREYHQAYHRAGTAPDREQHPLESFPTALSEAIESGIEFYVRQLVPYTAPDGRPAAYAYYNRKAKLGGSGVGLYMLALYQRLFRTGKYVPHARRLAHHLLHEILDSGEFRYYHVYLDRPVAEADNRALFSFYYPGEALLGLAHYCQHVCDAESERRAIYARIHDALRFLFDARPRIYRQHYTNLPADSWLMMAILDLWDVSEFQREAYSQPVFHDADRMVDQMYTPNRAPFPDYTGSFFYHYGDHPYPDGARAEGLLAAYLLARKTGDITRMARYYQALQWAAWATLRLCNTPDSVYSVPDPQRAVGGIRFKLTRQWFRVDTIQHVACFYLKFLPHLTEEP
ncbi:MAG: hypothetical protein EA424_02545 [Planctomycetaceae bacterium]|nr:MAG: hypothetical protein EA424_02545 [Planctomycetaceae bacterium]